MLRYAQQGLYHNGLIQMTVFAGLTDKIDAKKFISLVDSNDPNLFKLQHIANAFNKYKVYETADWVKTFVDKVLPLDHLSLQPLLSDEELVCIFNGEKIKNKLKGKSFLRPKKRRLKNNLSKTLPLDTDVLLSIDESLMSNCSINNQQSLRE